MHTFFSFSEWSIIQTSELHTIRDKFKACIRIIFAVHCGDLSRFSINGLKHLVQWNKCIAATAQCSTTAVQEKASRCTFIMRNKLRNKLHNWKQNWFNFSFHQWNVLYTEKFTVNIFAYKVEWDKEKYAIVFVIFVIAYETI